MPYIQNAVGLCWTVELNSLSALPTMSFNGFNSIDLVETYGHIAKTTEDNAFSGKADKTGRTMQRCHGSDGVGRATKRQIVSQMFHVRDADRVTGQNLCFLSRFRLCRKEHLQDAWCLPVVRLPSWRDYSKSKRGAVQVAVSFLIASQTWNWAKRFRLQCGPDAFKAPPLCVEPIFWTLELASA